METVYTNKKREKWTRRSSYVYFFALCHSLIILLTKVSLLYKHCWMVYNQFLKSEKLNGFWKLGKSYWSDWMLSKGAVANNAAGENDKGNGQSHLYKPTSMY